MSVSHRRGLGNNRTFFSNVSDNAGIWNDYHRLRLLENAVVNYGGGRDELEARVREEARRMQRIDAAAAALLREVAVYLHDVAITGELLPRERIW